MRLVIVLAVTRILDTPDPKGEAHKLEALRVIKEQILSDPHDFMRHVPHYSGELKLTEAAISVAVSEIAVPTGQPT